MKILALDSSGLVATVAVMEDNIMQAEYTIQYKKTHSQTLIPMLEEIREIIELDLASIDAIAVASGPGSFTGLRIGSATAKGLGLALEKPLIEVPTLEGLAYNLYAASSLVCPLMDAKRNQVYSGIYEFLPKGHTKELHIILSQCAVDISVIIEKLNKLNREVIFLGDGVPVFEKQLEEQLKITYQFAPANNNRQRAGSIAALGSYYYAKGKIVTAAQHKPEYLRLSQAERERAEKEQRENENCN